MFHGSSPTAERITPTTIDNSTSRASTASGGPPRKRLTILFAMGLRFPCCIAVTLVHPRRQFCERAGASHHHLPSRDRAKPQASLAGRHRAGACPSAGG